MAKKKFKKSSPPPEQAPVEKKGFPYKLFFIIAFAIGVIAFLTISGVLIYKMPQVQEFLGIRSSDPTDVASVVEEVSQVVLLPTDETPTFATVSDVTKLQDQEFFTNAQNGDVVLIYENAKKAYLYRPSSRQLIEIGPVTRPEGEGDVAGAEISEAETPLEPARLLLRNGTSVSGLTRTVEAQIETAGIEFELAGRENASSSDYEQTVVVDVSGTHTAVAQSLASELGGTVASLPEGEQAPSDTDILVILGSSTVEN